MIDPERPGGDDAALELALLERLVQQVPVPPPTLPGWQSLAAAEYAVAVQALAMTLAEAGGLLASARAAS